MQSISLTVLAPAAELDPLWMMTLNCEAVLFVQYGPYMPGLVPVPVGLSVIQVIA